jgi:ligand-binding SRPBCC domain-containing protein
VTNVLIREQRLAGTPDVDRQLSGPYRHWHHTHEFTADGPAHTLMRDTVRYELPFGRLGDIAHRLVVRRDLARIFDFRAAAVTAAR